jgi:hypothetical protein
MKWRTMASDWDLAKHAIGESPRQESFLGGGVLFVEIANSTINWRKPNVENSRSECETTTSSICIVEKVVVVRCSP